MCFRIKLAHFDRRRPGRLTILIPDCLEIRQKLAVKQTRMSF